MAPFKYNEKENFLIEKIHSVFPKVELDSDVAISAIDIAGGKLFNGMSACEPLELEAFFRPGSYSSLFNKKNKKGSSFFPSQFKPIPWWEIQFKNFRFRGSMDGMCWMSQYGIYYYLPFFLLATIHDLHIQRLNLNENDALLEDDMRTFLTPPKEIEGISYWDKIDSVPQHYKDPHNKRNLYQRSDGDRFLAFLSFLSEKQIDLISEFIQYDLEIQHKTGYCFEEFEDEKTAIERQKSCWKIC